MNKEKWTEYSDVGSVIELGAVFDDSLKKVDYFITYAVEVANRILMDRGLKIRASWGKWGARLEPSINPDVTPEELEAAADFIENHPGWIALKESTRIFTYGEYDEEIAEFQTKCTNCGENGHYYFDCKKPPIEKVRKTIHELSEVAIMLNAFALKENKETVTQP